MPFKTGLGSAGAENVEVCLVKFNVSMPFKTGLGTAGSDMAHPEGFPLRGFNAH